MSSAARWGIAAGEDTDPSRKFTVEPVACLGCCTLAPVVQIDEETHGHLRADTAIAALRQHVSSNVAADVSSAEGAVAAGLRAGRSSQVAGEVRIGLGSCCVANGSARVQDALRDAAAAVGASFSVKRVGCVGMCHQTPLVEIEIPGQPAARYARVEAQHAKTIVRRHFKSNGLGSRVRNSVADAIEGLREPARRLAVCRPLVRAARSAHRRVSGAAEAHRHRALAAVSIRRTWMSIWRWAVSSR